MDGQVVRLDQIQEEADAFVRVRLLRIDQSDLNIFEFDYDLTFMVFFLDAEEAVYARFGGRDASNPDKRLSLAGLKYTMRSVLDMHKRDKKQFAPKSAVKPKPASEILGQDSKRCLHCHEVKEALNHKLLKDGLWKRDSVWRYPLPENLGIRLEVDRGNRIENVSADSAAAKGGLKPGDQLQQVGSVPIHSFADMQFALDKAPNQGTLQIRWLRDGTAHSGSLILASGWRKSDISWRPSLKRFVPTLPLYGEDLKPEERKQLGLTAKQLAFRQKESIQEIAKEAGFRPGDLILGIAGQTLDMTVDDFLDYIRQEYLVGDKLPLIVRRGDKIETISISLTER